MVLSTELRMLFYSSILGIIQLLVATHLSTRQTGVPWNISARDGKKPELAGVAGRMDRAFKNFMETFPFFIAVTLIVQITTMANATTALGSQIYFGARILYVPLYAAGIPYVRTLAWLVSFIGILMVMSALL